MTLSEHYRSAVLNALGGFQLLEESLKVYLDLYYNSVRYLLQNRLHFDFHRKDIDEAPLGRLIANFAKVCSNTTLVENLRALTKHRDHTAHQALICLYTKDTSDDELHALIRDGHQLSDDVRDALKGVQAEITTMHRQIFGHDPQ